MKFLNNISRLFLFAAILLVGLWLLFNKFKSNIQPQQVSNIVQQQQKSIDSMAIINVASTLKHKNDSITWKHKNDSILLQLSKSKHLLNLEQNNSIALANAVAIAGQKKDTASYIANCNKLSAKVIALNQVINEYRLQNDSLIRIKDSMQLTCDLRLAEQASFNENLHIKYNTLKDEYSKLNIQAEKLSIKSNKKYTISLGGGLGVTTEGKIGGLIGIIIGRTVIRL